MKRDLQLMLQQVAASSGLASEARTRNGVVFDPTVDTWAYRDGPLDVHLSFGNVKGVTRELLHSLKATLAWYAANGSPGTLQSHFNCFKRFVTEIAKGSNEPINAITGIDYLNFRSTTRGRSLVAHLRPLFRKWHGIGQPGITDDLMMVMNSTREKGRLQGVAVATMDPKKGPFTDIELQAIQAALNDAYAKGDVSEAHYLLTWLYMAIGGRPTQFAQLKVRDVHSREVDGVMYFDIDIPRAKQKGKGPRELFRNRPLVKQIGAPLSRYAAAIAVQFSQVLEDPLDAPLFPQERTEDGKAWARDLAHHKSAQRIGRGMADVLSALQVQSERTGQPMRITSVRFRRTFGTRAAQEGHGVMVIAELLDHSDTQHAGVYVETRPEIAARIDKAVAMELAPIAQAFKGKLIRHLSDATRGSDPTARIRDLRIDKNDLACCGQHSFCSFNAPIACYECSSFEPWLDGPHEAVLDVLLAKREYQMATCDSRIATIHDRTILAVAQVVQLCRQQRGGNANA